MAILVLIAIKAFSAENKGSYSPRTDLVIQTQPGSEISPAKPL